MYRGADKSLARQGRTQATATEYFDFMIVWPCIVTNYLWIKPTDLRNSNYIGMTTHFFTRFGQPFCPSSGVLSHNTNKIGIRCICWFYSQRRFWFSCILFIMIIGGILVLFIYIRRLASNEIF